MDFGFNLKLNWSMQIDATSYRKTKQMVMYHIKSMIYSLKFLDPLFSVKSYTLSLTATTIKHTASSSSAITIKVRHHFFSCGNSTINRGWPCHDIYRTITLLLNISFIIVNSFSYGADKSHYTYKN